MGLNSQNPTYSPPQLGLGSIPKSSVEAVDVMLKDRQATLRQLKKNLIQAQERNKQFADKKRSERKFEEGDWVYWKLQHYRQITVAGRQNQKLSPRYCGPYEVIQKIGTCAYRLNLPEGWMIHPVFHVSQLKARVGDTQAISPRLPLIGPSGQLQIRPLAILARRMVKKKNVAETELLMQWVNQTKEDATWEDYMVIKQQFPEFLLEVEKNLKNGGMSRVGLAIMEGELNFDSVKSSEGEEETKGRAGSQVNEEVPLQQGPSEIMGQVKLDSCNKSPSVNEPEKKMGIITGEEATHSVEEFVESLATRKVLG